MNALTIKAVRRQPSGLWIIYASDGVFYSTRSDFQAAVAERYREMGTEVRIASSSGWHYRELHEVWPVAKLPIEAA